MRTLSFIVAIALSGLLAEGFAFAEEDPGEVPVESVPQAQPETAAEPETVEAESVESEAESVDSEAEPDTVPEPKAAAEPEAEVPAGITYTAEEVACYPRPGWAPALRRAPPIEDGAATKLTRAALGPVRISSRLLFTPLRLMLWTYDRYDLKRRFQVLFFDETLTYGLYPVAEYETDFGFTVGARFVHKDMFGRGERAKLRASYGGRFNQEYSGTFRSGERFGEAFQLRLDVGWQREPKSRFVGVGNDDLSSANDVIFVIDPIEDSRAVETRFSQRIFRVALRGVLDVTDDFSVIPAVAFSDEAFGRTDNLDDDPYTGEAYDISRITGFETGSTTSYTELELAYSSARPLTKWIPEGAPSTGWDVRLFAGWTHDFDRGNYMRYGADVQRFFNLWAGTRVLALRHYYEGVTGDLDTVSFVDLPRLGGPTLLRGYVRDRFRDRIAMVTTAEYRWGVFHSGFAYLFVDAGRVFRDVSDITLKDYRFGYGIGLQLHDREAFGARAQLAMSEDGLFASFSFDKSFYSEPRVRRQ